MHYRRVPDPIVRCALAVAMLIAVLVAGGCGDQLPTDLPAIPEIALDDFLPAVSAQVREARNELAQDPGDAGLNGKLGMLLHAYRQFSEADACYQRAIKLAPDSFSWIYYRADVLSQLGNFEEALELARRAAELAPDEPAAASRVANILLESGDLDGAGAVYRDLLNKDSRRADSWYGLGQVAFRKGEMDVAIGHLKKALATGGDFGAGHYAIALAYREAGDNEAAQRHLALHQQFIKTPLRSPDPVNQALNDLVEGDQPYIRRAMRYAKSGNVRRAVDEYKQALTRNPGNDVIHASLMGLYGQLGQFDAAERHYEESITLNPGLAMPHFNMGVMRFRASKFEPAAVAFERAIEINDRDLEARRFLAMSLARSGRPADAEAQYLQILEIEPKSEDAIVELARLYTTAERYDEAARYLERIIEPVTARTPLVLRDLAMIHGKAGRFDTARERLEYALRIARSRNDARLVQQFERDLDGLRRARELLEANGK